MHCTDMEREGWGVIRRTTEKWILQTRLFLDSKRGKLQRGLLSGDEEWEKRGSGRGVQWRKGFPWVRKIRQCYSNCSLNTCKVTQWDTGHSVSIFVQLLQLKLNIMTIKYYANILLYYDKGNVCACLFKQMEILNITLLVKLFNNISQQFHQRLACFRQQEIRRQQRTMLLLSKQSNLTTLTVCYQFSTSVWHSTSCVSVRKEGFNTPKPSP